MNMNIFHCHVINGDTQTSSKCWTKAEWQEFEKKYLQKRHNLRIELICKRCLDITISTIAVIILLPVFFLIALAVKFSSPGSILFCQERLGKLGKTFRIYKFRTMIDGAIHQGTGLDTFKGDPRVTSVGKFLREYHLDELPQLFNVLSGEMSLVGPRPLLPESLSTYNDEQKLRLLVKPGITAWEAVNGGLSNSLEKRLELDIFYVANFSLWLDLLILLRTIPVVLRKEGVYEEPITEANH